MLATLKIQSTKITERREGFIVEMTLSSGGNIETATDVVQIRVTIDTKDRAPGLAELQRIAMQQAQDAVTAEVDRLKAAAARR